MKTVIVKPPMLQEHRMDLNQSQTKFERDKLQNDSDTTINEFFYCEGESVASESIKKSTYTIFQKPETSLKESDACIDIPVSLTQESKECNRGIFEQDGHTSELILKGHSNEEPSNKHNCTLLNLTHYKADYEHQNIPLDLEQGSKSCSDCHKHKNSITGTIVSNISPHSDTVECELGNGNAVNIQREFSPDYHEDDKSITASSCSNIPDVKQKFHIGHREKDSSPLKLELEELSANSFPEVQIYKKQLSDNILLLYIPGAEIENGYTIRRHEVLTSMEESLNLHQSYDHEKLLEANTASNVVQVFLPDGKQEYECGICGVRLTEKCHLEAHVYIYHQDQLYFRCSDCKKEFYSPKNVYSKCSKFKNNNFPLISSHLKS